MYEGVVQRYDVNWKSAPFVCGKHGYVSKNELAEVIQPKSDISVA